MRCALFRRKRHRDSTAVKRAKAERVESEKQLEEVRDKWTKIHELSNEVDRVLRVNGFGEDAARAMRRRHT